jgi:tight adherence protein C
MRLELLLLRSGNAFGLSADELISASVFCALSCVPGLISALYRADSSAAWYATGGVVLGAMTPAFLVRRQALARQKRVGRELPGAIDLVALCMSAGLDFGSALKLWLERSAERDSPLTDELDNMARGLAMGQTRSATLRDLAHAVPSVAVVDFVNAVVQAEQKGTPLAVVIETQAHTLRLRRSSAAEQAAALAGVWLLLPLLLLLAAIMLVLFAPFIINGAGL